MLHAPFLIIYTKKNYVQPLWEQTAVTFFMFLLFLLQVHQFLLCLKLIAFDLLFTATFIFCNNGLYTNKLRESFNWMLIILISLFNLFFCRYLCCNSSSRIIRANRRFSLMLLPLVAKRMFANFENKCSSLYNFRNFISRRVLSYLVLMCQNCY